MKRGVKIHKTKKYYKIVTMFRMESWVYNSSEPIFLIPHSESDTLKDRIFYSLEQSKSLRNYIELSNKDLLKKLKESSFPSLYRKSSSCNIYFDGTKIEIEPQKCFGNDPRQGLETVQDKIRVVEYSKDKEEEIMQLILSILDELDESK